MSALALLVRCARIAGDPVSQPASVRLTRYARVARLQVRYQLLWARVNGVQGGVGYGQLAGVAAGALPVEIVEHVRRTADAAVIFLHASV